MSTQNKLEVLWRNEKRERQVDIRSKIVNILKKSDMLPVNKRRKILAFGLKFKRKDTKWDNRNEKGKNHFLYIQQKENYSSETFLSIRGWSDRFQNIKTYTAFINGKLLLVIYKLHKKFLENFGRLSNRFSLEHVDETCFLRKKLIVPLQANNRTTEFQSS